jgi:hypothetical protein
MNTFSKKAFSIGIILIGAVVIYNFSLQLPNTNDPTQTVDIKAVEKAEEVSIISTLEGEKNVSTSKESLQSEKLKEQVEILKKEQFQNKIDNTKKNIPTKAILQQLPEEKVHFTPDEIRTAAVQIGELAQSIHDDPSLRPQGVRFYKECAESSDHPTSIRASCLKNYDDLINLDPKLGPSLDNSPKISEQVVKLRNLL